MILPKVHFHVKMKWNPVHPAHYSYHLQLRMDSDILKLLMYPTQKKVSLTLYKDCLGIVQNQRSITALPAVAVFNSIWHCSSLALVSTSSCCRLHEVATRFDRRKLCPESFCLVSRLSNFCFASCRAAWSSSIFSSRSLESKFVQIFNKIFLTRLFWNFQCLSSGRHSQSHTSHVGPSLWCPSSENSEPIFWEPKPLFLQPLKTRDFLRVGIFREVCNKSQRPLKCHGMKNTDRPIPIIRAKSKKRNAQNLC